MRCVFTLSSAVCEGAPTSYLGQIVTYNTTADEYGTYPRYTVATIVCGDYQEPDHVTAQCLRHGQWTEASCRACE